MWGVHAIGQWYFKREDFEITPSRKAGLSGAEESTRRAKAVKFIQEVGYDLKLPQITIATAAIFLHRFYMRKSLTEFHHYDIAGTCIFEACKTEETVRKMDDVARICAKRARKELDLEDPVEFNKWKHTITKNEVSLLEALMFDLHIEHPYRTILKYAHELKVDRKIGKDGAKSLAQTAWGVVNDSLRAPVGLIFRPNIIASASVYIAAKMSDIPLNDDPSLGPAWHTHVNDDLRLLADAVDMLLSVYSKQSTVTKQPRSGENLTVCKNNPLHYMCTNILVTSVTSPPQENINSNNPQQDTSPTSAAYPKR